MKEKHTALYLMHFYYIPELYHKDKNSFMMAFGLAPDQFLANIYTEVWQKLKPRRFWRRNKVYPKENFKAYKKLFPDGTMISYVTLPEMEDNSPVSCKAYALVITSEETKLFTIEKSVSGTMSIGTVNENGDHIILGNAGSSVEENMEILHQFEVVEEEHPAVEKQKTVNPDGSYVEVIQDHRNNRVEITEYDAQGNRAMTTYGSFEEVPEVSDDDINHYLANLDSRWTMQSSKVKTAEEWLEEGKSLYKNKKFEDALKSYIRAADLDNAEAQNLAALMHYRGEGTSQDNEQAFNLFKKSAENGNVSAMGNLAIFYENGIGTTKDYVLARKWYEEALENGTDSLSAINNLGYMHLHGLGTEVDYDKAQMYFERAIRKGCKQAEQNLEDLKKRREEESKKSIGKEIRWQPKNILDEVRMMVLSCSSPPIVGTPEENARRVMQKIEYFRQKGVAEGDLYELEGKILQFMPDFAVENFEEFYAFLKEDISSIYITMELLMAKGDFAAAKKIADPLAAYLERHKAKLIDGHHCHQNSFETALYTLEVQRAIPTQSTQDNYTAFLVAYARILQNTRIVRHNQETFRMAESRKYLKWAQEMSPQNASVWLYLGVTYNDNEQLQLEYYKKALRYCYLKDGDYGLTKIYECLAMHYWGKNQIDVVAALKELVAALGGNPFMLSFLLSKQAVPANSSFLDVLQRNNVQIGFSDLVCETVDFLEDPRAGVQDNQEVQAIMHEIRTVEL